MEQEIAFGHNVQTYIRESEEFMLRKIRIFYWKQRDRGLGKQTIMFAIGIIFFLFIVVGVIIKSAISESEIEIKNKVIPKVTTGASVSAVAISASGVSVSDEEEEPNNTQEEKKEIIETTSVDTTGLNSFLGFMSEAAYEELKNQLITVCQYKGCKSVKKLNYQQTKGNGFYVTSFVLLSDGSVYQCDYNLKSCAVAFSETNYTEARINQMKEKELLAEQERLKEEQKKAKKKLKKEKSKNKKKSKKKYSGKKKKSKKSSQKKRK